MKIAIHYFSGCGNTAWLIAKAQQNLLQKGHEIVFLQNIEQPFPNEIPQTDLDIFMAPTYFFGPAPNFVSYLKRIPMVASKKAIFISVNGGVSGASKWLVANLLKDRGYDVIASSDVKMPDTFLFLKESQKTSEERKETLQASLKQLDESLNALEILPPVPTYNKFKNFAFTIVYGLYYVLFRHTIGLSFVVSDVCSKCGWCAQNCPSHAIYFDGTNKPVFKTGCVGCFRCVNVCPVRAIDYSKYALIFGGIFALLGWFILPILLPLGILSKIAGLFTGWFAGCYVFQKFFSKKYANADGCFKNKQRVWFSDEEKNL